MVPRSRIAIKKQPCVGIHSASESLALACDGVSLVTLAGETTGWQRLWGPESPEFVCSPCVCMGSAQVLKLLTTVQRHARVID